MNKVVSVFIALSLCGCALKFKEASHKKITTIASDRNDVITIPQDSYKEKFRVKPLEYSTLIARNPISIGEQRESYEESVISKAIPNSHEKWLRKMRAHVAEMESRVNGVIKSGGFDIKSIPIGVSYKLELDKPRKRAKNCNDGR